MLTFFFKTLRFLLIVGLVLFLGQLPVNGRTVGEHFSIWVKDTFKKTNDKIAKSSLVATLRRPSGLVSEKSEHDKRANDNDGISSSDRESLLRVLQ